jgi:hypothetical protein
MKKFTIMHPPHKKNVRPPVAKPIEHGYTVNKKLIGHICK